MTLKTPPDTKDSQTLIVAQTSRLSCGSSGRQTGSTFLRRL